MTYSTTCTLHSKSHRYICIYDTYVYTGTVIYSNVFACPKYEIVVCNRPCTHNIAHYEHFQNGVASQALPPPSLTGVQRSQCAKRPRRGRAWGWGYIIQLFSIFNNYNLLWLLNFSQNSNAMTAPSSGIVYICTSIVGTLHVCVLTRPAI